MGVFPLDPMDIRPIAFGDEGQVATRGLARRFEACARDSQLDAVEAQRLRAELAALEALDRQYGGMGALGVEDADAIVDSLVAGLARLDDEDLVIGVALWAIRHEVAIGDIEPVVNALALRSNRARSKQEIAAVFGLMQGVIASVSPRLAADLERSNPERPWRIAHLNLAITAIRSEDPALLDFAFDALDAALPDERAGFYAEALALALAPGVAPAVCERIEARLGRWTG